MSERNVERLRAMYEAFNREDFDAAAEFAHPEIEVSRLGQGTIRGSDALRAWMKPDALEMHTVEPLAFKINGNTVLVQQRHRARGVESGIEVEAEVWVVYAFDDDGLATRVDSFMSDEGEALKAAGLSE